MEVVHDQPSAREAAGNGGGVGLVGVDDHMADPCEPRCGLAGEPVGDGDRAASRQNIDEPAGVEIHDPGHQQARPLSGGGEERGLVQPDRPRSAEAGEVVHVWAAVVAHCGHRRVPRHPEVPGGPSEPALRG